MVASTTSMSSSGSTSIDGLISGLDTTSLINSLMAVEAKPRDLMVSRQATFQASLDALKAIGTKLNSVTSALTALQRSSGWATRAAATTDATVATATAAQGAAQSTLSFTVDYLAAAHGLVTGTSVASTDTLISSGTLDFTIGGQAKSLSVGNGSLASVADAINTSSLGIKAAIVNTGTGYRLQIASSTSGAASAFTLDSGLTGAAGGTVVSSQGLDAQITVGSGPGAYQITSAKNTFQNVVPGVAITVNKVAASPVTISVGSDGQALADKVKGLVTAVNDVLSTIKNDTAYDPSSGKGSVLTGDSSVRQLASSLVNSIISAVGQSSLGSAGLAGLSVDKAGAITFDQSKFLTAYANDPASVERLFVQGGTSSGAAAFLNAGDGVRAGNYDVVVTAGATSASAVGLTSGWNPGDPPVVKITMGATTVLYPIKPADTVGDVQAGVQAAATAAGFRLSVGQSGGGISITAMDAGTSGNFNVSWDGGTTTTNAAGTNAQGTIGGIVATGLGNTLTVPYTDPDLAGLSVSVPGSVGPAGTISYEPGVAQRLATAINSATKTGGSLDSAESTRQSNIKRLTDSIEAYNIRLDKRQANLRTQYSALEVMLGKMKSQGDWLTGQLNSLPNISVGND